MTREVRTAAICAGAVILGAIVVPRLVNVNSFRPTLETELSAALGRQVKIGQLSLSMLSGTVSADDISIADDAEFSSEPFLVAKSFSAAVELGQLMFSRTLHVTGIKLEAPQITLLHGPNGTWNFSTVGKARAASGKQADAESGDGSSLSVDKLTVTNGRVIVGNEKLANKPAVYENVNVEVRDVSSTQPFLFAMMAALPGGGDVSLNGKGGPIITGNTASTPFEATMTVRNLQLDASASSSGIEGMADLECVIRSANQQLNASGTMKADKLKLAAKGVPMNRSVGVNYELDYDLKTGAGKLTQGEVAIGKAVTRLTGGYQTTQGHPAALDMKLIGSAMPVDDLEAALLAAGVVLPSGTSLQGGAISVDFVLAGQSDKLAISGPIRLSNTKLVGFDFRSKMSGIPALASRQTESKDTSIENLSATVRVFPEGVQANAINVDIADLGVITGGGAVSSGGELDFVMNAMLTSGPGLIEKAGTGEQGGGVPFSIQGTTFDPKFIPDVKSMAGTAIARKVTSAIPETPTETLRARRR